MGPIDYTSQFTDPVASAMGGFKLARGVREAELQEQAIAEAERMKPILQAQQQEIMRVFANPNSTLADYRRILPYMPKDKMEGFNNVYKNMGEEIQRDRLGFGLKVMSAYENGANEVAEGLIKERVAAMESSGGDPKELAALKQAIGNPRLGRMLIGAETAAMQGYQSAAQGVETFQRVSENAETLPVRMAEKESEIAKRRAETVLNAKKYNLDVAEYERKVLKDAAELSGTREPKLGAEQVKEINKQSREAEAKISYATQAAAVADKLDQLSTPGGIVTKGWNAAMRAAGVDMKDQFVRDEYDRIRSQGIIKRIPPGLGQMSNADREFFEKGFPPASADPAYIARFMRVLSKAVQIDGQMQKASAAWENSFGTLPAEANRDIQIYGVSVPKGANFEDFQKAYINSSMPSAPAAEAPTGGKGYLKYGQ